jgi:hypothetical protein
MLILIKLFNAMLHINPLEDHTRNDIIDKILEKIGWDINDYSKVIEEIEIDSTLICAERLRQSFLKKTFSGTVLMMKNITSKGINQ